MKTKILELLKGMTSDSKKESSKCEKELCEILTNICNKLETIEDSVGYRIRFYPDKITGIDTLDLFKRLPHLNEDKKVIKDWGYIPNLYHFDTRWHVSWIHYDDSEAFIDFEGETPEEAIQRAYDWCVKLKLVQ